MKSCKGKDLPQVISVRVVPSRTQWKMEMWVRENRKKEITEPINLFLETRGRARRTAVNCNALMRSKYNGLVVTGHGVAGSSSTVEIMLWFSLCTCCVCVCAVRLCVCIWVGVLSECTWKGVAYCLVIRYERKWMRILYKFYRQCAPSVAAVMGKRARAHLFELEATNSFPFESFDFFFRYCPFCPRSDALDTLWTSTMKCDCTSFRSFRWGVHACF